MTKLSYKLVLLASYCCAISTLVVALQVEPSRRDFLGQTASSVVAGSSASWWLPPPALAAADEPVIDIAAPPAAPLKLPKMGMGCWAWGDSLFWGYNPKQDGDLEEVFKYAVSEHAPVLFDTAELYGLGRSETLLGDFSKTIKDDGGDAIIMASKFAALPWRTKPDSVVKACQASVNRLGGKPIDLYQIHFPNAYANAEYWDGLAMAYEKGLVKAVGVSNYGVDATIACHKALAKRGIPLATNQIQYNLLYRHPETNGLLQTCKDLGVQVLAYSPMALGLLTGKYTADNVKDIQGPRKGLFEKTIGTPEFDNLLSAMKQVASNHHGENNANLPQVAINWCRAKGTIPIPGARTLRQVQSNYGALEWDMSPEEVKLLDQAALFSYVDPNASPFPKVDKDTGLKMFDS
jgi:pyridoxine 4-dehydrogenase